MKTIGIIPAAGKAKRWGQRTFKELLPITPKSKVIDIHVDNMFHAGAREINIITSRDKFSSHALHFLEHPRARDIHLTIQEDFSQDLWGAILLGIQDHAEEYLLSLPDTCVPINAFSQRRRDWFNLGLFETNQPQRFGVLWEDRILDKSQDLLYRANTFAAWGLASWDKETAHMWRTSNFTTYSGAFSAAMSRFHYSTWFIGFYYDLATFDHYCQFLAEGRGYYDDDNLFYSPQTFRK